ncbi:MAG: T9SS type A sorting domain-containing protein [Bacteroidota bacterium]
MRIFPFFLTLIFFGLFSSAYAGPGDTTVVHTFRFDTNMRAGVFNFPDIVGKKYEKILMLYSMRCKNGLISTQSLPNQGCGEWDYNCYTYVVDSSQNDSLLRKANRYKISDFNGNNYPYSNQPVYNYIQLIQPAVTYTNTISETISQITGGSLAVPHPLGGGTESRSQYLYKASELSLGGLVAGSINGIVLNIGSLGSNRENLKIRIKAVTVDSLNAAAPILSGFTDVYFQYSPMPVTGQLRLNFPMPFYWDGTSNLLIDISYHNPSFFPATSVLGDSTLFTSSLNTNTPMGHLRFKGGIQSMNMNPGWFDSVSQEISIGFWCFGDSVLLPANTAILEGTDNANTRQVNIHLPWSNSNIYWDCGSNASGYDRINKAATPAEIKGRWNFWTFTKNATTGRMKIYLNGSMWLQDSNKTRPINLKKMLVGSSWDGTNRWAGYLSELSIWNKELSQNQVQHIMMHSITSSDPSWNQLMVYYPLNSSPGNIAVDHGPKSLDANLISPVYGDIRGSSLFRDFSESNERPATKLIQGTYTSLIINDTILDSVVNISNSVISYATQNNNLVTVDTSYSWHANYAYIFNESGQKLDSIPVHAIDTLHQSVLTYFQRRPMRVELINFITPYGKGLSLNGLAGKTWTFDVTDYAPILKGKRYMAMSDGIYQEDNDITFVFYEGTPPRDVKKLQQIWPSGTWVSPSWSDIYNNVYFEPRQYQLSTEASQFKIRSSISGHGQEGEFIARNHTITVNDTLAFTRQVWTACATNPIYPQGGTWIYDRAGWCPGAAVDRVEFKLPSSFIPGQVISLDYKMPFIGSPGSSNYRVNNQLVSYGAPNFSLDAAIDYVKQPSGRVEFSRLNPLCSSPVVAIKNTGSTNLTSADIIYGRKGGIQSTYHWTGNLAFLASTEVSLPIPDWQSSQSNKFIAKVSNPNGGVDQYPTNDSATSAFFVPGVLPSDLVFEFRTNSAGYQNILTLKDSQGNVVLTKSNLANNMVFFDTLYLMDGCYVLSITDAGDNGLYFWNEASQGTGYFRINSMDNNVVKNFNSDFGDNIYFQFTVGFVLPVEETPLAKINSFEVYPNPANTDFTAAISVPQHCTAHIKVMNMLGQTVKQLNVIANDSLERFRMDGSTLPDGIYFVVLEAGNQQQTRKLVIKH